MVVIVTCKYEEDPIKNEGARVLIRFPHYNPMGAICCHGNDLIQNLLQPFPHPNDASNKIGLLVAEIFMFESVN